MVNGLPDGPLLDSNYATGPYNLKGVVPHGLSELSLPLAFQSADLPRQIQFGLRIVF